MLDGEEPDNVERQLPTFATPVHEWREALDLVGWRALGQALDDQWGTSFPKAQWFAVLEPARKKTLRGVCELLATRARRAVVPPAKMLGRECASAGVFLAIRSLLVQAGALPDLRPSTPLGPYLEKWPEVFLQEIAGLVPGSLLFTRKNELCDTLIGPSYVFGGLLLVVGLFTKDPWQVIGGVILYLPIDQHGADLLFQVISQRYERGSIVLTTNKPFKQWASVFNNDSTIASAVLDRLLHHADTIVIEGSSYRMKDQINP